MKVFLTACLSACLVSLGLSADLHCINCGAAVQGNDAFCASCGKRLTRPVEVEEEPLPTSCRQIQVANNGRDKPFSLLERFAGMGRGLLTAVFSPMCLLRGMDYGGSLVTGGKEVDNLFTAMGAELMMIPGVALGSVGMCADVIDGVADLISFGYYGDWLYCPETAHSPTPWFWERKWDYSDGRIDFPWITK